MMVIRAVASNRQTEAFASVLFFFFSWLFVVIINTLIT